MKKLSVLRGLALVLLAGGAVAAACASHKTPTEPQPPLGESTAPAPSASVAPTPDAKENNETSSVDHRSRELQTAQAEPFARDAGIGGARDAGLGSGGMRDGGAPGAPGDAGASPRGTLNPTPSNPGTNSPGLPAPNAPPGAGYQPPTPGGPVTNPPQTPQSNPNPPYGSPSGVP